VLEVVDDVVELVVVDDELDDVVLLVVELVELLVLEDETQSDSSIWPSYVPE